MDIAERIKKLRESYNITSNDLANITGIHPVSIRKYETRKMVPGIEVIDKMRKALKLPRMIFEGIPQQYTDYSVEGDFYQLLFLLMANGAIEAHAPSAENSTKETYFTLNQQLSKYIEIKNGDETIPWDKLTIHHRTDHNPFTDTFYRFEGYLLFMEHAQAALKSKRWNEKKQGETREQYAARLTEAAEKLQLELMLAGHSWEQHMTGLGDPEQSMKALEKCILNGGDFYEYILQANIPETVRDRYIEQYEDAYISEIIAEKVGEYPLNGSWEERFAWTTAKLEQTEKYKEEHPDYKEQAKQHAIEYAEKVRKEASENGRKQ